MEEVLNTNLNKGDFYIVNMVLKLNFDFPLDLKQEKSI